MGEELESEGGRTKWRLAVGGELILGGVLGTIFLGSHSLWLDESVSSSLATAPWHRFTEVVAHREPNMALYYLFLRGWVFFGHGEAALRSLSVIAAVGALAVVIMVTRDLFGQKAALICGLLLAVDPLFVEFAQDVRGYSLCLVLVSASSFLFIRGIQKPLSQPWVTWTGYTLVTVLAAYTNFWAALVPLSHAVSLAFLPNRSIPWRKLAPTWGAVLVLLVPLALLIRATDSSGVDWAAGSSAGHILTRIRDAVPHVLLDLGAVVLMVGLFVVVLLVRRHQTLLAAFERNWAWLFALCWLGVPLAAVILLSVVYKPLLVIRYLMVCVPPAAILVGAIVARATDSSLPVGRLKRLAATIGGVMILGASSIATVMWYNSAGSQDWRSTVAYVGNASRPGDGVLFVAPYVRIPFEWYVGQEPPWSAKVHPVYPSLTWGVDPLRFDLYVSVSERAVAQAALRYQRVWLVLCDQKYTPQQLHAVTAGLHRDGFGVTHTKSFKGVEVVEEVRSGVQ